MQLTQRIYLRSGRPGELGGFSALHQRAGVCSKCLVRTRSRSPGVGERRRGEIRLSGEGASRGREGCVESRCLEQLQMAVASQQKGKSQREGGQTEDWPGEASEIRFPPGTWLEAGLEKATQSFQEDLEVTTPNPTVRVPGLDCWASDSRPGTFLDMQLWAQAFIFLYFCHRQHVSNNGPYLIGVL